VGKYKVNRETACKPKEYGGLGILNLTKFASALQMRWLCHEWNDEAKPWVGLGNPCTHQDKELFAAATRVTTENGRRPKDIAPPVFKDSQRKKCPMNGLGEKLTGHTNQLARWPLS
jgi:hypothetical protein